MLIKPLLQRLMTILRFPSRLFLFQLVPAAMEQFLEQGLMLGANVSLTATPVAGAKFKGWIGDATGTNNPLSITLNDDMTIAAEFEPDTSTTSYALNLTSSPSNYGSVSGAGTFAPGSVVQLSATPVTGAVFTGWSGSATGADNPLTITMDAAKTVTANFIQDPASLLFCSYPFI